jgi:uncharacterized protein YjbI with pentapeptide repeats
MANQQHLDLLKQSVKTWNQWRKEHSDVLLDLSEADLSRTNLNEANLNVVNLSGANLSGADLSGADLSQTNLNSAIIILANLSGSNLSGANLSEVYLLSANLSRTNLNGAYFNSAICRGTNLSGVDLKNADLSNTNMLGTDLSNADLSKANLRRADLSGADLSRANLSGANLSGANLSETDLSEANLSEANLSGANLNRVNLSEADLSHAHFGGTIFSDIDFRFTKGLDTVEHRGPSTIGTDTLVRSGGDISEVFLRGAGLPDTFIDYVHSLVNHPIKYYTCFISYSDQDVTFSHRLYADLQHHGVRCWFAPEDMKTGDKIRQRIDQSIRIYDKLLIVLSQHSIQSTWVEFEVEAALAQERISHRLVLFPVRLDDAILTCETSWAAHLLRTRHITNFSAWKKHDAYQKVFTRLLRDLQASTPLSPES